MNGVSMYSLLVANVYHHVIVIVIHMLFQASMITLNNSIHKREMHNYIIWCVAGKPRHSYLRDMACVLLNVQLQCKLLDETVRADLMVKSLPYCNSTEF